MFQLGRDGSVRPANNGGLCGKPHEAETVVLHWSLTGHSDGLRTRFTAPTVHQTGRLSTQCPVIRSANDGERSSCGLSVEGTQILKVLTTAI